MYALVEIAAQPTETLPAGAMMEVWEADPSEYRCLRTAEELFQHDLKQAGLERGTYAVEKGATNDDPVTHLVEWTMPGKPTRRFRIQILPS